MDWLSRLETPANALAILTALILTEMEFVAKASRRYAGDELANRPIGGPLTWLGKKIG